MLYLYTGVPGAGKTLYAVSNLVKRKDFKDRPIFVDGIKDLDHDKINYFRYTRRRKHSDMAEVGATRCDYRR